MKGNVRNIWRVWLQATLGEREHGLIAYPRYRARIESLILAHGGPGVDLYHAVGVFSALSPNSSEKDSLSGLCALLRAYRAGRKPEDAVCRAYPANRDKAWRILEGEDPLTVLGGPKTRAFFLNILHPESPGPVTVDAHAYSVWMGKRLKVKEPKITAQVYQAVSADYRLAGSWAGVRGNQIQAVCWFAWRRIHGLGAVNADQYVLFEV